MDSVDWNAAAALVERDDCGSELNFTFREVKRGRLGELVRDVAAMPIDERSRVVIEIAGGTAIGVGQIMDLAAREDIA